MQRQEETVKRNNNAAWGKVLVPHQGIHITKIFEMFCRYWNPTRWKKLTMHCSQALRFQAYGTQKVDGADFHLLQFSSVQFSSVAQSCLTLCNAMNCSMPGLPVHDQLPESTQIHVHWVSDAIQSSHPLSSPSPPALNLSQLQGLFKRVSSSHQVAKVLEFQL